MTATQEETTRYNVVSSTYSTAQEYWTLSKDYKLLSTVTNLTEKVGESVVGATGKYTGVNDLTELDSAAKKSAEAVDESASPYLERVFTVTDPAAERLTTFVYTNIVDEKRVVAASEAVRAVVAKNLEVVERNMKIVNPETTVELVA